MRQGVVAYPVETGKLRELDLIAEAMRTDGNLVFGPESAQAMIQAVDVFPHLARDAVADGSRIFPHVIDAGQNRIGIVVAKAEKFKTVCGFAS